MASKPRRERVAERQGRFKVSVVLHLNECRVRRCARPSQLAFRDEDRHRQGQDVVGPSADGSRGEQVQLVRVGVPAIDQRRAELVEIEPEVREDGSY